MSTGQEITLVYGTQMFIIVYT